MLIRKANLPLVYTEEIYQSSNLIQSIKEILQEESIYKALWFYNTELIQAWEKCATEENAEAIAKYVIRMATRTTVNQLFGVMMTNNIQKKEEYSISIEYLKAYFYSKLLECFDKQKIRYRTGNLLQERKSAYYINGYLDGTRKIINIPKDTVIGRVILCIQKEEEITGSKLCMLLNKMNIKKDELKIIIAFLCEMGAIITNVDIEGLAFLENNVEEQKEILLNERDYNAINGLLREVSMLDELKVDEFQRAIQRIERQALDLLGQPFEGRVVNGHSRQNSLLMPSREFGISNILKKFFEVLGATSTEYLEMQEYEKEFVAEYGMFQAVSLIEAISLYEKIKRRKILLKSNVDIKKVFEDKIKAAQLSGIDEIKLTAIDLEEIICIAGGGKRKEEMLFDLKYQKHGKNIVLSNMDFCYPGSLFCAYLDSVEMEHQKDINEKEYLYYCPKYLESIGWPRGMESGTKIRIDSWDEREIHIKQLAIMVDFDGMHLVNIKNNKKVLPLNPTMKSFQFQIEYVGMEFLDKLGRYLTKIPSSRLPIDTFSYSFIPRISYKNIIIQPKRWIIEGTCIVREEIEKCFRERNINRYVYLVTESGEARYMDLKSPLACKWLIAYARKHTYIVLEEAFCENEQCTDYIMRVRFKKEKESVCSGFFYLKNREIPEHSKRYLSWHLIYEKEKLGEIKQALTSYLSNKEFFYIHYIENGEWVLRLRIKDDSFIESRAFMNDLVMQELIQNFSIQNYQPEVVRYGGMKYINKFEKIFELESQITLVLNMPQMQSEIISMQMATIVAMLKNVLGEENVESFLNTHACIGIEKSKGMEYYQKYKNVLLNRYQADIDKMEKIFQKIDEEIKESICKIVQNMDNCYADYILLSLLHMRLNRLYGVSEENEKISFQLAGILYKKYIMTDKGEY